MLPSPCEPGKAIRRHRLHCPLTPCQLITSQSLGARGLHRTNGQAAIPRELCRVQFKYLCSRHCSMVCAFSRSLIDQSSGGHLRVSTSGRAYRRRAEKSRCAALQLPIEQSESLLAESEVIEFRCYIHQRSVASLSIRRTARDALRFEKAATLPEAALPIATGLARSRVSKSGCSLGPLTRH